MSICRTVHRRSRCLDSIPGLTRQSRWHSDHTSISPSPPPPPSSGATRLARRLISLCGHDAPKFLQGLVTNNVAPQSTCGFYTAFLRAQGKVLYDVFVYPTLGSSVAGGTITGNEDDAQGQNLGYMLEVDANSARLLLGLLKKHKLRSKVSLRLLDEQELEVWNVWHDTDLNDDTAIEVPNAADGILRLQDPRAPGMGQRLLTRPSSTHAPSYTHLKAYTSIIEAPLSAYTIRRYLRGIPEGQFEMPSETLLPMNANMDTMHAIDFRKGCYLGQELTIRTHHTGVVRKRILPVMLYDSALAPPETLHYNPAVNTRQPEVGTDIRSDTLRAKPASYIAGIGNVGLAMCRLRHMTDLEIGEGSHYEPDTRFYTQTNDQKIGVKAFVPDWLRSRIRPAKVPRAVEA